MKEITHNTSSIFYRIKSFRFLFIVYSVVLAFILSGCATPHNTEYTIGYKALEQNNLEEAYRRFLPLAQASDIGAMNNLGVIETRRGNLEEANKWYRWAALLGSTIAANNLGANAPKVLTFGIPLPDKILMCDLLLDSVYVLPDLMALHFKVQTKYSSATPFSINALTVDRGSEPYLHGVRRNVQSNIPGSGHRLFSAMIENSASSATLSITCDRDTSIVTIPLRGEKIRAAIDSFGQKQYQAKSNEIRMIKSGGVYEVPVQLNDVLKIKFIIDSGASEVFISPDVALTLYRTGTIEESDWLPGKTYQFADGSSAKSRRFLLRSVTIGGRRLTDIPCAISSDISSPMLLGQSVLERLGKYSIDYDQGILVFQ